MINKKTHSSKLLYRSSELIKALGISQTTLWRWQKNGSFPRPIKLGPRIIAWKLEDINNWLEKK